MGERDDPWGWFRNRSVTVPDSTFDWTVCIISIAALEATTIHATTTDGGLLCEMRIRSKGLTLSLSRMRDNNSAKVAT